MKKLTAKYRLSIFFLLLTSFIFLFISYIPNFYEASVVDLMSQDRVMLWGEHVYTYDYNVYLSKIRQGMEGRWSVVDKYDNNPHQKGVFFQMLYLLSGKVGGLIHFSPSLTFHLLRTFLSVTFVLTIIALNVYFLKKPSLYITGTLLSLLAASFPLFYPYQGTTWVGYHMGWWQEMDVLRRVSYVPHYMLNYIIICALTWLLYIFSRNYEETGVEAEGLPTARSGTFERALTGGKPRQAPSTKKYFWIICFILFLSFFIHPTAGLLFILSWSIFYFVKIFLWREYSLWTIVKIAGYSLVLLAIAAAPLLYIRAVTSIYPWKSLVDFDIHYHLPFTMKEYLLALGPVFFLGLPGIILTLVKKNSRMLVFCSWVGAVFLGIFLFKKFFSYQSEMRFVQTAVQIPLAILTVYFLFYLKEKYNFFLVHLGVYLIIMSVLFLGVVQSYFSIKSQTDFIHQRAVAMQPLVPYPSQVMYPLKDFYNGMMWLEKNSKREDVVLSKVTAGNYIPAYAGNFVFVGHNPETPFYDDRVNAVNLFFSGTMNSQDAQKFLKSQNISYIFYGPQEKENSNFNPKNYPFLKEVYSSVYVSLYKVP